MSEWKNHVNVLGLSCVDYHFKHVWKKEINSSSSSDGVGWTKNNGRLMSLLKIPVYDHSCRLNILSLTQTQTQKHAVQNYFTSHLNSRRVWMGKKGHKTVVEFYLIIFAGLKNHEWRVYYGRKNSVCNCHTHSKTTKWSLFSYRIYSCLRVNTLILQGTKVACLETLLKSSCFNVSS